MSATFDTTTKTAYDAATSAAARATAIVASLSSGGSPQGAVLVKVYSGASPDTEMGSGTMSAPWATASGGTVVIGEVSSFTVGTTGTPNANWYIKFQTLDGTRWAKGSFGLSSSTQDFTWSLDSWTSGQTGSIGTATIVCTGNSAPVFTVAPTTASLGSSGGTIQFTATDPDGGTILYSLTSTRSGITINSSTGLVTVTSAAAATSGNIVVQASDGILTASTTCAVTVAAEGGIKWNPGHYMFPRTFDQATRYGYYNQPDFKNNANIQGVCVPVRWSQLEGDTRGVYSGFTRPQWASPGQGQYYAADTYGISWVREELEVLKAMGKRMILRVFDKLYQGANSYNNWPSLFPAYLNTAGKLFLSNARDLQWMRWDATATGWYVNLFEAYAAEFDGDPYFEMIAPFQESTVNTLNPDRTIPANAEALTNTSYRTLAAGIKAAWPTTNVWMPVNWSPYGSLASYTEYLRSIGVGTGNPDTSPTYNSNPSGTGINTAGMLIDQINRGQAGWGGVAANDYRSVMPMFYAVESSTLGWNSFGPTGGFTAQQIFDFVNSTQRVSHMLWERNNDIGTDDQRWYDSGTTTPGGILDVINSQSLTYTSKPVGYP